MFRQERYERSRPRRGAEILLPQEQAPSPWILSRSASSLECRKFQYILFAVTIPSGWAVTTPYAPCTNWLSPLPTFPQGLWNVEGISVEKSSINFLPHPPVEICRFSTLGLWKKSRCGSKRNCTFPHKFPLLLLLLQIYLFIYIFIFYLSKRGFIYAFYL